MIAMPPTVITVAELPVEPDALQAFALEQNRCVKKEAVTAEDTSGDSKASRKLLAETLTRSIQRCLSGVRRSL
jgi:hypothetical protein